MADTQYITKNELDEKANKPTKLAFVYGVPTVLVLSILVPQMAFGFIVIFIIAAVKIHKSGDIYRSGMEGEDKTLAILTSLPDSYTLFNQIKLPDPKSSRGVSEIDFVAIGPNGIFVIEVKNNGDPISGSENAWDWTIHKTGRRGNNKSRPPFQSKESFLSPFFTFILPNRIRC